VSIGVFYRRRYTSNLNQNTSMELLSSLSISYSEPLMNTTTGRSLVTRPSPHCEKGMNSMSPTSLRFVVGLLLTLTIGVRPSVA
jgi:hypothetical protein